MGQDMERRKETVILTRMDMRVELKTFGRSKNDGITTLPSAGWESYIGGLCRIRMTSLCETDRRRGNEKFQTRFAPQPGHPPPYPRLEFIMPIPEQTPVGKIQLQRSERDVSRRTIPISNRPLASQRGFQSSVIMYFQSAWFDQLPYTFFVRSRETFLIERLITNEQNFSVFWVFENFK